MSFTTYLNEAAEDSEIELDAFVEKIKKNGLYGYDVFKHIKEDELKKILDDDNYFESKMKASDDKDAKLEEMVLRPKDENSEDGNDVTNKKHDSDTGLADALVSDIRINNLVEVLNTFQGDIPLNNSVVVLSTNCINTIDEAFLRPGRCDLIIELKNLTYKAVNGFYKHHYEVDMDLDMEIFKDVSIRACDLQSLFESNPFDKDKFIAGLVKV